MEHLIDEHDPDHARFLDNVRATGEVWGLKSSTGWAVCESGEFEDTVVYPFWADAAAAAAHCTGDWAGFTPAAVGLDEFIERWLPGMSEDDVLVGTNWDADLSGPEWEPLDLAEQLLNSANDADPH